MASNKPVMLTVTSMIHSFIYSHSMDPYKVIQNDMDVGIVNGQYKSQTYT
jgi:hypothetical protein